MILKAYAIQDIKAGAFVTPFFCPTHGIALRMFSDECQSPKSNLNRHPDDFKLFCIGSFDDNSGVLSPIQPEFLDNATTFVPKVS